MFHITWKNIKSAIVSGLIVGVLGVAGQIISVGDVFKLDWHALVNVGVISALTACVSALKSLLTTDKGNFAGIVKIK